jgi:hypothetical protein
MARGRLDDESSIGEQGRELRHEGRSRPDVALAREEQDGCPESGQGRAGGRWIVGAFGAEDGGGRGVPASGLPRVVGLRGGVPPAVGEGVIASQSPSLPCPAAIRSNAAAAGSYQGSPWRSRTTARRTSLVAEIPTA